MLYCTKRAFPLCVCPPVTLIISYTTNLVIQFTTLNFATWSETDTYTVLNRLALYLNLPASSITIVSVTPGSVIVTLQINADDPASAQAIATSLNVQLNNNEPSPLSDDVLFDIFSGEFGPVTGSATFIPSTTEEPGPIPPPVQNAYIVGNYTSTPLSFYNANGTTTVNLLYGSAKNSYIVKYDTFGYTKWAVYQTLSNSINTPTLQMYAITADTLNNIYVVSNYTNASLDIYSQTGTILTLPSTTTNPINSLIKYDGSGNAQWAAYQQTSAGTVNLIRGVTSDTMNNIYVAGNFTGNLNIYSQGDKVTAALTLLNGISYTNGSLIKYDGSGTAQWAAYQATTNGSVLVSGVTTDKLNNVYVIGTYKTALLKIYSQGNPTETLTLPVASNIFNGSLIKYDGNGNAIWAAYQKVNNGSSVNTTGFKTDTLNNIYVACNYTFGSLNIYSQGNQLTAALTLPIANSANSSLIKYDGNGNAQWAAYQAGSAINSTSSVIGLTSDISNNIYVTGVYRTSSLNIYSNGSSIVALTLPMPASGGYNSSLIKYDQNGTAIWAAYQASSVSGNVFVSKVTVDTLNNIYVTGVYQGSSLNIYSQGNKVTAALTLPTPDYINLFNNFIIKYDTNGVAQWASYTNNVEYTIPGPDIITAL